MLTTRMQDVSRIASTLESVVKYSFGPHGLDKLVTTESNRIIVTNSGEKILRGCEVEHPVARYILSAVTETAKQLGDGSTTLMLLITAGLKELSQHVRCGAVHVNDDDSAQKIKLAQTFAQLRRSWMTNVFAPLLHSLAVQTPLLSGKAFTVTTRALLTTLYSGKFGGSTSSILAELILQLLAANQRAQQFTPAQVIAGICASLNTAVTFIPGAPLSESIVQEGLLIERKLLNSRMPKALSNVLFVVFRFSFALSDITHDISRRSGVSDGSVSLRASSAIEFTRIVDYSDQQVERCFRHMHELGIEFVVSTEALSDVAAMWCLRLGIAAVQNVDEESASYLCRVANVEPVFTLGSALQLSSKMIGRMAQVRELSANAAKNYLHLVACCGVATEDSSSFGTPMYQLVLRGTSDGICRQYVEGVHKGLSLLRAWLGSTDTTTENIEVTPHESISLSPTTTVELHSSAKTTGSMLSVPGAGAVELATYFVLERQMTESNAVSEEQQIALRVLQAMAAAVPQQLLHNSVGFAGTANSFFSLLPQLRSLDAQRQRGTGVAVGIVANTLQDPKSLLNTPAVWIADPIQHGILEPLNCKYAVWSQALDVLVQLLRLDSLVSAAGLRQ